MPQHLLVPYSCRREGYSCLVSTAVTAVTACCMLRLFYTEYLDYGDAGGIFPPRRRLGVLSIRMRSPFIYDNPHGSFSPYIVITYDHLTTDNCVK